MARILIIDDDPMTRSFLMDVCEQFLRHETAQARNLQEALELTATFSPDAVLLDRRLEESDAEDYLTALARTAPDALKIPKWIISGERPIEWDTARTAGFGVAGYLVKPCRMDELKAALESVLGDKK